MCQPNQQDGLKKCYDFFKLIYGWIKICWDVKINNCQHALAKGNKMHFKTSRNIYFFLYSFIPFPLQLHSWMHFIYLTLELVEPLITWNSRKHQRRPFHDCWYKNLGTNPRCTTHAAVGQWSPLQGCRKWTWQAQACVSYIRESGPSGTCLCWFLLAGRELYYRRLLWRYQSSRCCCFRWNNRIPSETNISVRYLCKTRSRTDGPA